LANYELNMPSFFSNYSINHLESRQNRNFKKNL